MYLLSDFDKSSFSEKIALITASIIAVGLFYKLGFYSGDPLNSLWVVQFFSIIDLAYASIKMILIYLFLLITFNKILVTGKYQRNLFVFNAFLLSLSLFLLIYGLWLVYLALAIIFGCLFNLLYFHKTKATALMLIAVYLTVIPYFVGASDVLRLVSDSELTKVKFKNNPEVEWMVLDKAQDKILLINVNDRSRLKIVGLDEIDSFENKKPRISGLSQQK